MNLSFWDLAYTFGFTPWDTKEPPEELIEYLNKGKVKPCKSLDIGCGKGYLVRFLAKNGFDAYGIDISSVAIKIAISELKKENIDAKFFNIDFTKIEEVKKLGKFKLITDIGCYHSLRNNKRDYYIKSLDEVADRGSIFMIWAFGKDFWGPPGIEENELEEKLKYKFKLIDKRQYFTCARKNFFFVFEKTNLGS